MSTTWTKKCGTAAPDPCGSDGCTSGTRNHYYTGKRLTPDAMRVEQDYLVERRRLLNRALHGWGVVYGYPVALKDGKLAIGAGLALDRMGRELVQTAALELTLDDLLELPAREGACWMLRVHYAEQPRVPIRLHDDCHCERTQWDQLCETVRYSLQRVACAECCAPLGCELACDCEQDPCSGAHKESGPMPRDGAMRCMCSHLTALGPGTGCSKLTKLDDGAAADLHNGVALACLTLSQDNECKQWRITAVTDACGPRRLVKRADLLFDLIRGCDLTRISRISWAGWHRAGKRVDWQAFEDYFAKERSQRGGCVTAFEVWFSRPVRKETVTPDCFAMTFLLRESEGGWELPLRAPILRIEHGADPGDPPELVRSARLVVSWKWVGDAIRGPATRFEHAGSSVEIEIRGDFILDCNGQALDANPRGALPAPTGNGTPGGTYLSRFDLTEKPVRSDPDKDSEQLTDNGGKSS